MPQYGDRKPGTQEPAAHVPMLSRGRRNSPGLQGGVNAECALSQVATTRDSMACIWFTSALDSANFRKMVPQSQDRADL